MILGFDYIEALHGGGNGRYSRNLINAILRLDKEDTHLLFYFLHDFLPGRKKPALPWGGELKPGFFSALGLPVSENVVRRLNKVAIRFFASRYKTDIFHFTNPLNFSAGIKNSVVTMHDLAPLYDFDWVGKDTSIFFNKELKNILKNSSKIIAVSKFTRDDIVKRFGMEEKITVVYEGVQDDFYRDEDKTYVQEKFDLDDFILYVGQLQPRKNILNLIRAYAGSAAKKKFKLVLVGRCREEEYRRQIEAVIQKNSLEDRVRLLGRVPDEGLRKLYSCAGVFVFPSFFEGFGLPVLESLRCGTPVIASKNSSLPEVTGSAGLLIDPHDAEGMSGAIDRILADESLRGKLAAESVKQSLTFSWEKAAKETVEVYRSLSH